MRVSELIASSHWPWRLTPSSALGRHLTSRFWVTNLNATHY